MAQLLPTEGISNDAQNSGSFVLWINPDRLKSCNRRMNKCGFTAREDAKATTNGRRSLDPLGSSSGGKHEKCVVFPANASMAAEALERRDQTWTVRTKFVSDLIIQVGASSFQLHMLPMVSRSVYLNRLVFQRRTKEERHGILKIKLDSFPGGAETFALVVRFCYGFKVDLTAANIAPLHCAAHFLEMSDDLEQGNLMSKTEAFLSFILVSSWKDIFVILKSCETISSWAKDLHILQRCSEAVAWKACIDPTTFTSANDDAFLLNVLANNEESTKHKGIAENWWFEDVASLRIDHFGQVIESIKSRGMKPELIGLCIAHWTAKWLSHVLENLPKHLGHDILRVTAESLIEVLPEEDSSVSCNFLLHLLKLGLITRVKFELLNKLKGWIALMLEECSVSDILVKNYCSNDTMYDVGIVIEVVETYASSLREPAPRIFAVGRLVDRYLALVARDEKLSVEHFRSLAEALPTSARYCDDHLYRAIDMYLKAHPNLTEEERTGISKAMDYHKLSQEARQHAMKNGRLPMTITTRLILLEQVNMTRSMIATGSNYRRTRTQAIIRVTRGLEKESTANQKEISLMKKEVENLKLQLNDLQMCKIQLQRQAKI